jgi:hypothetical protein
MVFIRQAIGSILIFGLTISFVSPNAFVWAQTSRDSMSDQMIQIDHRAIQSAQFVLQPQQFVVRHHHNQNRKTSALKILENKFSATRKLKKCVLKLLIISN